MPAELQAHRRAGAVRGALVLRDYGLVQYFSSHALWTVPEGTAFLLLVGVGVELSLMFSIAGLVMSNFLPADPALKILGIVRRGWPVADPVRRHPGVDLRPRLHGLPQLLGRATGKAQSGHGPRLFGGVVMAGDDRTDCDQ